MHLPYISVLNEKFIWEGQGKVRCHERSVDDKRRGTHDSSFTRPIAQIPQRPPIEPSNTPRRDDLWSRPKVFRGRRTRSLRVRFCKHWQKRCNSEMHSRQIRAVCSRHGVEIGFPHVLHKRVEGEGCLLGVDGGDAGAADAGVAD